MAHLSALIKFYCDANTSVNYSLSFATFRSNDSAEFSNKKQYDLQSEVFIVRFFHKFIDSHIRLAQGRVN